MPLGSNAPKILGIPLDPLPRQVLSEIMESSGVASCLVTSVGRTPHDQARIMYENVILHGLASQYTLYGPFGDKVLDVYRDNSAGVKDAVVELMEAKVIELGPENVSHHCSMVRWVWDVGPESIEVDKHLAFLAAAQRHPKVVKLLTPLTAPKDPAFHFEVPR